MSARAASAAAMVILVAACSTDETPEAVPSEADASTPAERDGGAPEAPDAGDAGPGPGTLVASSYCETVAEPFCAFYMRCGRMVAKDEAECRKVFLETCNARFEPRYVDLERAGLLALSDAGVAACAKHLTTVSCLEQASDLDGPCARMWTGRQPAGKPCGLDVESFVCASGATCILGLDFCGTCEPAAARGAACKAGEVRCAADDACIGGVCTARAFPGEPCSDTAPCTTGATCTAGTCVAPTIVGEGEACDSKRRCAYRSVCDGAKCVRTSLLGEPCASTRACVSGRCQNGTCVALRSTGEACAANAECSSGQCTGATCTALPTACFAR